MRITNKKKLPAQSIGIFLMLKDSTSNHSYTHWSTTTPFRIHATVFLPKDAANRVELLRQSILEIQHGRHFTVNIDWNNCQSYITEMELRHLETILASTPIHLYNKPSEPLSAFVAELYAKADRESYLAECSKGVFQK